MWVIHTDEILKLSEMKPHQELLLTGQLHRHDGKGFVTFVSHQWAATDHPDPNKHQLTTLQDTIQSIRNGCVKVTREGNFVWGRMIRDVSPEYLAAAANGWIWIDFACVPQVSCCQTEPERVATKAAQLDAIMSLHAYVGRSSCFTILAPTQHHHESAQLLSYRSWRSRGWCQFELATAMLAGTKPVLLVSSKGSVMHLFHRVFCQLAPCLAEFTVEEDRQHIARTLREVAQQKAAKLRAEGNHHEEQLLQAIFVRLLQFPGEPTPKAPQARLARLSDTRSLLAYRRPWSNGWTDLHCAVSRSSLDFVHQLLKAKADVNAQTCRAEPDYFLRARLSPLHVWSMFSSRVDIAELLIGAFADVNAKADNGWTPLMLSCEASNEVGLHTLIRLKADLNAKTYVGLTPLCCAVTLDCHDFVEPLLDHNADVLCSFFDGYSLLHLHATLSTGDSVELLLNQGLDINQQGFFRMGYKYMAKFGLYHFLATHWNRSLYQDIQFMHGGTPLICAAARGNVASFQRLLEAKADTNIRNANGDHVYDICLQTMPHEVLKFITTNLQHRPRTPSPSASGDFCTARSRMAACILQ